MIDLPALHYALMVRDSGSFRKAATALGVRASVVSRKVRAFEDAIGVMMFLRFDGHGGYAASLSACSGVL